MPRTLRPLEAELLDAPVIWIRAAQFDRSGETDHRHLQRVRWSKPDSHEEGESTVDEIIELIRAHTLVYVSDDLFDRTALVRVVDAKPPYIRSWAHGRWGNDLLALPRFGG
jgi:hypothetical protein